jgi:hypothetical protein
VLVVEIVAGATHGLVKGVPAPSIERASSQTSRVL